MAVRCTDIFRTARGLILFSLLCLGTFYVKRPYFISTDTIGLSIVGQELLLQKESYFISSLFVHNTRNRKPLIRASKSSQYFVIIMW